MLINHLFERTQGDESSLINKDLITNFDKEKEPLYRQAIRKYGWNGLYIDPNAYAYNGQRLEQCLALRIRGKPRDLSGFWKIYRSIPR